VRVELWFDDYAEEIYRYIFFIVKDHHTAENLTQDTFIRAHINSHQFKGKSAVRTWLYRIAYTTTMNYFRRNYPVKTLFNTSVHKSSAEETFFNQND